MQGVGEMAAGGAGGQPPGKESGTERVASSGRIGGGHLGRGHVELEGLRGIDAGEDARPACAALDHDDRRVLEDSLYRCPAEEGLHLDLGRKKQVGRDGCHELPGRPPTFGQERSDGRQIE